MQRAEAWKSREEGELCRGHGKVTANSSLFGQWRFSRRETGIVNLVASGRTEGEIDFNTDRDRNFEDLCAAAQLNVYKVIDLAGETVGASIS